MSNPSLERALRYEFRAQEDEGRGSQLDGDDVTVTPSQAEGDRGTVERDEGDPGDDNFGRQGGGTGEVQPTPSQAEGDRETVEEDIQEKDGGGHA